MKQMTAVKYLCSYVLKEEAQDLTLWRIQFWRGYGPVARQTTTSSCIHEHTLHSHSLISTREVTFIRQFSYHIDKNDYFKQTFACPEIFPRAACGSHASSSLQPLRHTCRGPF
jgi:hypothetical protein